MPKFEPDKTTQSNYLAIATDHVAFDWMVDFERRTIGGSALHSMVVKEEGVGEVVFDSGDLTIKNVEVDGERTKFDLEAKHPVMGSALRIPLAKQVKVGTSVKIFIEYTTSPDSTALGWLEKEQTQGKTFPYLFSQCQPIYARALAPMQDTPSLKITYSASVSSKLPVLMSARRVSPPSAGPVHDGKVIGKDFVTYSYRQPTRIPSYLLAIASGDVRFKPFDKVPNKDWTTGVWAEPDFIDACYDEFSDDTRRFLAKAEETLVPYKFGVYDLLVLPPSFPYGGMENACLTFITPSLVTGDRSLTDVVVHELTHSWFGNGVTHTDASHFWLNEGWTTYIERLLLSLLHSPAERGFSFLIGSKALKDALAQYADQPKYQRLVIDFEVGEDPDDAYSSIPYEKGANFILYLERLLGGVEIFLPYVKDYVNTFMGKSINTWDWKSHLYKFWSTHGGEEKIKLLDSVDWDAWLFGEGLELPVSMEYDLTLAQQAFALAERWNASRAHSDPAQLTFLPTDVDSFNSNQKAVFLERLQSYPPLPSTHIELLGDLYSFRGTSNAELRYRFYELALMDASTPESHKLAAEASHWTVGDDGTGIVKGRMKFCRPVLRAANKANPEVTQRLFLKFKKSFHPIAQRLLEKDLGLYSK